MQVVESVLEKRLLRMVSVDEKQFGFMPERLSIDGVFILRRLQGEYYANRIKFYVCFVDLEKAFDRVLMKVLEWAMRKKGIPDVLVRSGMSVTRVIVDNELSEELDIKMGIQQ